MNLAFMPPPNVKAMIAAIHVVVTLVGQPAVTKTRPITIETTVYLR
jgi:hypothetical protein